MVAETAEQLKPLVENGKIAAGVFETDDIRGDYERLSKDGVAFGQPPKEENYGTYAIATDTSGNSFRLTQLKR